MMDFANFILLTIIVIQLTLSRRSKPIEKKYYFEEEIKLNSNHTEGHRTLFYFYTVSQFIETISYTSKGLEKELGFSEFQFIYDRTNKKFYNARVKIIGIDGYDEGKKAGFFTFFDDVIEINIQLNLKNYTELFKELRISSKDRALNKKKYFLYDLTGISSMKMSNSELINSVNRISTCHVYDEYYADKNSVMLDLMETIHGSDLEQSKICTDLYAQFMKINTQ